MLRQPNFPDCKFRLYCDLLAVIGLVYLHAVMSLEEMDGSAASDDGKLEKRVHMEYGPSL